jgi:hypothetical protein
VHGLRQTYHRLGNRFGHPMELIGDEAEVEACFGPFGDSANLDEVHGLRGTYHRLGNWFRCI